MTTYAQLKMHYEWPSQLHSLRTLHLFAGIGGELLADNILRHHPVCAVEIDTYCRQSLAARQTNGSLPWFPCFGDVQAFDGKQWRGLVDAVCGGFPCTDISSSGKSAGIDGKNSGLWREFARILGEVRPQYAFIENSPRLASLGLNRVLADLAALGFDVQWGCLSAAQVGADHGRDRMWIVAKQSQASLPNTNSD